MHTNCLCQHQAVMLCNKKRRIPFSQSPLHWTSLARSRRRNPETRSTQGLELLLLADEQSSKQQSRTSGSCCTYKKLNLTPRCGKPLKISAKAPRTKRCTSARYELPHRCWYLRDSDNNTCTIPSTTRNKKKKSMKDALV